jgi:hypothetical protein
MSLITEIENILLAIQIKQSKYKYDLIQETTYNQLTKRLFKKFTIIKFHKEKIEIEGSNKVVRIEDDKVRGNLTSLINYLVKELKNYEGADDS